MSSEQQTVNIYFLGLLLFILVVFKMEKRILANSRIPLRLAPTRGRSSTRLHLYGYYCMILRLCISYPLAEKASIWFLRFLCKL